MKGVKQAPIRVKVYGMSVTKRGYLILLAIGLAFLLGLLALELLLPLPSTAKGATSGAALVAWLLANLHWIVLAAMLLEGIEAVYVLRHFRREEAKKRMKDEG